MEHNRWWIMDDVLGSTVAEYTGKILHHKVRESSFFDKKDYESALKDAFLTIDKELKQGISWENCREKHY